MSEIKQMKAVLKERLVTAVEDIFGIIENIITVYEEKDKRSKWEIARQKKLMDVLLKSKTKLRADPPQLSVSKEEVPPEQQERTPNLGKEERSPSLNQEERSPSLSREERSPSPDQEDPEPLLIKEEEEEEEVWTNQEAEQLQWLEDTDAKDPVSTVTRVRSNDQHQSQSPHLYQSVENREGEPLPSTSTGQMDTDAEPTSDWLNDQAIDMVIHAGQKPYGCIYCGKRFTSNSHLSVHMRVHTGERPYSCSVCGKKFEASYLKAHMMTHTGERPYSCSICGKGFITSSDLERHIKTHTGERPYSCNVCGKRYIQASNLKKHMMTHTGERPYSCSVCGKGFKLQQHLKKHMKTHESISHTAEIPSSCDNNVC